NYSGLLRYNLDFRQTRLFRPFAFLEEVPLLHPLAGIKLSYTPAAVNASVGIERDYTQQHRRIADSLSANVLQQSHSFNYNTAFGFEYNLTPSINTSFQAQSVFDLSRAGISRAGDSSSFSVRPSLGVLQELVFDTLSTRKSNYQEAYTVRWHPELSSIEAIDWIDYSAHYGGGYQWRNSPLGSGLGANISNNLSLTQSIDLDFQNLLEAMPWYRRLEKGESSYRAAASDTSSARGGIGAIARRGLRALLSMESLDFSFNISKSAMQSGYAGGSRIYEMFNQSEDSFSPPFSYRAGFGDRIGRSRLIDPLPGSSVQLPSNRNLTDVVTVGARFRPFDNLIIDLTWDTQWNKTNTESTTINPDGSIQSVRTRSGRI